MRTVRYRPPHKPPPGAAQINRAHPLASGLLGCWLFNEMAGARAHDIARGKHATISGASWTVNRFGSALSFNGSSDYVSLDGAASVTAGPCSIALAYTPSASGAAASTGLFDSGPSTANTLRVYDGNGGVHWHDMHPGIDPGATAGRTDSLLCVFTYTTGDSGKNVTVYRNGVSLGSASRLGVANTISWTTMRLGDINSGFARYTGLIHYFYTFQVALTATDALTLHLNPYAFLASYNRVRWDMAAAGGLFVNLAGSGGLAGTGGLAGYGGGLAA